MQQPFLGEATCPAAAEYQRSLPPRFEQEAQTLARLTGWDINEIRRQLPTVNPTPSEPEPWWEDLWPRSERLLNPLVLRE